MTMMTEEKKNIIDEKINELNQLMFEKYTDVKTKLVRVNADGDVEELTNLLLANIDWSRNVAVYQYAYIIAALLIGSADEKEKERAKNKIAKTRMNMDKTDGKYGEAWAVEFKQVCDAALQYMTLHYA